MTLGIPHLTFAIRQSLDRLAWQHGIYDQEFLERMKFCFGHPSYFTSSLFGIVAPTDPASNVAGGSEPLVVSTNASTQDTTTVDVNPGAIITKSGNWAVLSTHARQIELANTSPGIPNVVYMVYTLQPADVQKSDYVKQITPLYARLGDLAASELDNIVLEGLEESQIYVDEVDTFLNYTEETIVDYVPLAIVTVQETVDQTTGLTVTSLIVDHTRDNYTWNRPWFSVQDVDHRSKLGSGTQTDNNTHALGFGDIDDNGYTLYQLMLNHGMIKADDRSIAKIPGYRCEAAVLTDQLLTDDTLGTATGFPLKKYAELPYFPIRVGKCWIQSSGDEVGVLPVVGTNKIVFVGADPPSGETVNVYFSRVEACEPPIGGNEVTFSTNNPAEGEMIIAGGQGKNQLANTQESFSDSQKFPMRYFLYVDGEAAIRRTPQVIYCYKTLASIGIQDTPTIDQYAPGHIMVGLTKAASVATMVVKIHVYGTDENGANIDEVLEFNGSNWSDFSLPSATVPFDSVQITTATFASVTNIVVDEATDEGPNAAIMLWAINTPYDSYDEVKDACLIADVMWDGLRMSSIYDKRIVETTIRDFQRGDVGKDSFYYWVNLLAGAKDTLYVEDFKRPLLHCLEYPKDYLTHGADASKAKYLPFNNFNKLGVHLEGVYRTRALPVFDGSGSLWTVSFLPQQKTSGTNHFAATEPRIRFRFLSLGWTSWLYLNPVVGIPNTFNFDLTSVSITEIPTEIQVEVESFPYGAMAVFG